MRHRPYRAAAYRAIRSSMTPSAAMAMPAASPLPNSWSWREPGDHDVAEAAAADHAADDHHRQHVEQALVGGEHQRLARHRQLDLGDHLPGGAAGGPRRLDGGRRDAADAVGDQLGGDRHGVRDRRHDRGEPARRRTAPAPAPGRRTAGSSWKASRNGRIARSARRLRPIATPSTTAISITRTVAISVIARVTIVSFHSPVQKMTASQTTRDRRRAPAAEHVGDGEQHERHHPPGRVGHQVLERVDDHSVTLSLSAMVKRVDPARRTSR